MKKRIKQDDKLADLGIRAEEDLRAAERLAQSTIDALSSHIAILDETGLIIAVNRAWRDFAQENLAALADVCEGVNYLTVCDRAQGSDSEEAAAVAAGIRAVLRGEQKEFSLEYPCHSPNEIRWFIVRITCFHSEGTIRIVVAHENITERKQIEDAHLFLVQCDYLHKGEDFFESLARYLAQNLGMDYVCIDRLLDDELTAQTVAIYYNGKFEDNVKYTLKDTPCGDVVGKDVCCFPKDVRHLFPQDAVLQEMKAESYIGTTLWSFDGKPIGLVAVIGRKPLINQHLTTSLMKLVSVRAAGELERQRVEAALKERYKELNCLYGISSLLDLPDISLDGRLKKIVMLIPPGWQFPEITEACIVLEGQTFQTARFRETPYMFAHEIMVHGKQAGQVKVCYLEERQTSDEGPFLTEERHLLDAIAERIGSIIERMRAEESLMASKDYLNNIINTIGDPLFVKDGSSRFVLANNALCDMLGIERENIIGKTLAESLPEDQMEHFLKVDKMVLE